MLQCGAAMLKITRSLGQVQRLLAVTDACSPTFLAPALSWALTLAFALQVCSGQDGSALTPSYVERNLSAPPPSPKPEIRTAATPPAAKTVHLLSA